MREVEVERVVDASRPVVERALTPENVVAFEGSFSVESVEEAGEATIVQATGGGVLSVTLRFEPVEDGWYYTQAGEAGPFDQMETWVTATGAGQGTRVAARSRVSLGLPLPLVDRVAAWKRRGELRRLLDRLTESVE